MRSMQQKFRQAPLPERYASPRYVKPACHTSTALWLNRCQCWSRDRRRVASSCGCVSAGVNRGANVRRTSATGDEVEGTTNVIARLVAFKFSFDDGYGMRFHPVPHDMFFFALHVVCTSRIGPTRKV